MGRQPSPITSVPAHREGETEAQYAKRLSSMAQSMAEQRRLRMAKHIERHRREADSSLMTPLALAAVLGGLNDLPPSDPTPSDFTVSRGDFGGGGASGDY